MGGACDGGRHVQQRWDAQMWGSCRHCVLWERDDAGLPVCPVLEGREPTRQCEALAEHLADPPRRVWRPIDNPVRPG